MKATLSNKEQVKDIVYPCLMTNSDNDDALLVVLYTAPDTGIVVYGAGAWAVGDEIRSSTDMIPYEGAIMLAND